MATKQRTSSPNYFGNLKTSDANLSSGANVNIFNATAKGARATGINLGPKGPTQAEKEKAQSDAIVAHNLENSPQINWSQFQNIPNSLQQNIMSIVTEKAAERGYLTHLTKRSGATDFIGKSEIASQINSNEDLIMNHIPGQLEKFSAILDGFPEDAYNNNFSVMNDPKDVTFNSNLSAGKGEYSIDENFNILVDGKSVNEIKPLEPINYEMGSQMLKTFTSAYDNGVALSKNELGLASTNFKMALNKNGTGALLSTAFDDTMSMNGTLLNQDDYKNEIAAIRGDDPDAKMQAIEKIKLAVTDAYLEKLTQQANDGVAFKQSKNNPTITSGSTIAGVPGYGSEDGNIDVMNFYNNFDFGYDAVKKGVNNSMPNRAAILSGNTTGNFPDEYNLEQHLGNRPEISDLGIYLASNGYNLGIIGRNFIFEGEEMDGEQAKAQAISKFTTDEKRKYFNPQSTKQEQANILGKYITPGKNKYSLSSRKLGTANTKEERSKYAFDVDPNNPETLQAAINKLSKLN
jgi:hypothetical protein